MVSFTIDDTGFHEVGLNGYIADWESTFRSIYGNAIDLSPGSPDSQIVGVLAQRDVDFEQAAKQIYLGRSPSGAVGTQLSRLMQLNGISRQGAQFSTVPILLTGTPSTIVPIDSLFADPDDPSLPSFKTVAPYTIGGGGTVTGQGICTEAGPVPLAAKTLAIQTVTGGWTAVESTDIATLGRLVEPDPQARARRALSVATPSQSMLDGLYAALANLPGVSDVVVYENTTGVTNAKGEPPHSIHVIIDGGIAADIADAIWTKASMGCTKFGSVRFVVTDSQGNPQEMGWDISNDLDVYITVQLNRTPNAFETASIQNALVAFGQETSRIGRDVPWADLFTPVNDLDITGGPGQPSITGIFIDSSASPTAQVDLSVAFDERPRYNASRILVVGP
jgi:uncharacterized phage protein gp47/JayE